MSGRSVLSDADVLAWLEGFDNAADPVRARIDWMIRVGLLEVHKKDTNKPWGERRLRRTAKGEAFFAEMEASDAD